MKFLATTITATTLLISILAIKPPVSHFNKLSTLTPTVAQTNDKWLLPRENRDNVGNFYNKKGHTICPPWKSHCTNEDIETFDAWACSGDLKLNVDLWKQRDEPNCQSFMIKNKQCFNLPAELVGKVKFMRRPPTPWGAERPCMAYKSAGCRCGGVELKQGHNEDFVSVMCDFTQSKANRRPRSLPPQGNHIQARQAAGDPYNSTSPDHKNVGPPEFYDNHGAVVCHKDGSQQNCRQIDTFDSWFCTGKRDSNYVLSGRCEKFRLTNNKCFDLPKELEQQVTFMQRAGPWFASQNPCTGFTSHGCPEGKRVPLSHGDITCPGCGGAFSSVRCFFNPADVAPYFRTLPASNRLRTASKRIVSKA